MNTTPRSTPSVTSATVSRLSCLAVIAAAQLSLAQAAVSTWSGNIDSSLATGGNWDLAPVSGDSWVFGAPGSAGTALTNDLTTSAFEVSGITFNSGATTAYAIDSAHAGTFTLTGNITVAGGAVDQNIGSNLVVSGSRTATINSGNTTSGNLTLGGNLTGDGTLTLSAGSGSARSIVFSGDNSGFTGAVVQNNHGPLRTAFSTATAGSAAASWTFNRNVNGGVALNFTNSTIRFGALSGGGFIRANGVGTVTVEAGALGADTTFSGIFQQGNSTQVLALTKVGSGMLTLGGNSTHAGGTTIRDGKVQITNATNALGSGAIAVNSADGSATLGGTGVATAAVTFTNGSRVAPGAITSADNFGGAGTLTLSGGVTFTSANLDFDLATTAAGAGDVLALGAGAVTYGTVAFNFSGSEVETGVAYTLFTNTGTVTGFDADSISTTFLGGLAGRYSAAYSLGGGTVGDLRVVFSAIPEPSAFATLAGLGVLGLAAARRRRG